MDITEQLGSEAAVSVARYIGISYIIAALGVLLGGLAALFAVIRWW